MAACTFKVATADTGASPNTSGSFTPAANDLVVVCVYATGNTETTDPLTSSVGGFTYTQVAYRPRSSSDGMFIYISDALASNTAQTVTWDDSGDPASGTFITVYCVSGMTKTGLTALRQSAGDDNTAVSGNPGADFSVAALTGNPTLIFAGNATSPAGLTPPASWTENASADVGYANPTAGATSASRDSGFTGTTIDWGASASYWVAINIELDASGTTPIISTPRRLPLMGVA